MHSDVLRSPKRLFLPILHGEADTPWSSIEAIPFNDILNVYKFEERQKYKSHFPYVCVMLIYRYDTAVQTASLTTRQPRRHHRTVVSLLYLFRRPTYNFSHRQAILYLFVALFAWVNLAKCPKHNKWGHTFSKEIEPFPPKTVWYASTWHQYFTSDYWKNISKRQAKLIEKWGHLETNPYNPTYK